MSEIRNVRYPLQMMLKEQRKERSNDWLDFLAMAGFCSMMLVMLIFAGIFA